jgi:hypothetical protein
MVKNKRLREFSIDGVIADDSFLYGHREKAEKLVDMQMRDSGYVPHLDLDTQYFMSYNEKKNAFEFTIVAFGVFVGKRKAWEIVGLTGHTFIKK